MDNVYGFDERKSASSKKRHAAKAAAKKEAAAANLNLKHLKLVDIPTDKELQRIIFHRDVVCATIAPYLPIESPEVPPIFNHESLQLLRLDVQNDARGYIIDQVGISLPALRALTWFGNGIHDARLARPGWEPGNGVAAPRLQDGHSWIDAVLAIVKGTKKLRHIRVCQMNPPCNPSNKTSMDDFVVRLIEFKAKRLANVISLHLEGWHIGGGWDMVLSLSENAEALSKQLPELENIRLEISPFEMNSVATLLGPFKKLKLVWISVARSAQSTIDQRIPAMKAAEALRVALPDLELVKIQSYVPVTGTERDEKLITFYIEVKEADEAAGTPASVADVTDVPEQWNTTWFFAEASDLSEHNPMAGLFA